MKSQYKISVIVPSYNQGKFIENVIQSVINQSYSNWELIIQDGASTDSTKEVCNKYTALDKRIIFHSEKDKGFADAVNKGLDKATGEIGIIQSSDDFFAYPDVFKDVITIYERNPDLNIVAGASVVVTEDLKCIDIQERLEKYIPVENIFTTRDHFEQGATFFSIKRALSVGKLNPEVDMVADTDFWIRMACYTPVRTNAVYQCSKIWGAVVVQEEQRSSDYSKFYLGRAKMATIYISDNRIEFQENYKKKNANNFIVTGIQHYLALSKNISDFEELYKKVNNKHIEKSVYSPPQSFKSIIKQLIFGKPRNQIFNNKGQLHNQNAANHSFTNYKWWSLSKSKSELC